MPPSHFCESLPNKVITLRASWASAYPLTPGRGPTGSRPLQCPWPRRFSHPTRRGLRFVSSSCAGSPGVLPATPPPRAACGQKVYREALHAAGSLLGGIFRRFLAASGESPQRDHDKERLYHERRDAQRLHPHVRREAEDADSAADDVPDERSGGHDNPQHPAPRPVEKDTDGGDDGSDEVRIEGQAFRGALGHAVRSVYQVDQADD